MIEVLNPGFCPTIQDYPGRTGYWEVGVPPSGPMDSLSFRIANKLVGNKEHAAALEMTALGPTLQFHSDEIVALAGAPFGARLNGEAAPMWRAFCVRAGDVLNTGALQGRGFRCYLAVQGGFEAPRYLGSRATFAAGAIGGVDGRPIRKGDRLESGSDNSIAGLPEKGGLRCELEFPAQWEIGAVPGPHSFPDYIKEEYQQTFFESAFKISTNSNRMGIRLEGPKPVFAREDGGEGGAHPSNIVDSPYPLGAITLSGDTPIILCADGPSFGGFLTFATVPNGELWKLGQVNLGEAVHFKKMTMAQAIASERRQEELLRLL